VLCLPLEFIVLQPLFPSALWPCCLPASTFRPTLAHSTCIRARQTLPSPVRPGKITFALLPASGLHTQQILALTLVLGGNALPLSGVIPLLALGLTGALIFILGRTSHHLWR